MHRLPGRPWGLEMTQGLASFLLLGADRVVVSSKHLRDDVMLF